MNGAIMRGVRRDRQREAQETVGTQLQHDRGQHDEPPVGASTWASGSQVCTGHIGTFTANAMKKAKKISDLLGQRQRPCARSGCRSEPDLLYR
jgi:hypothetical protein